MKSLHPTFLLVSLLGFAGLAQGQTTSAVPPLISYQGRVIGADGVDVGLTTPQSRTVTFRVWDSPTASQANNLLYSEQQTVTISKGEFSVLMGQGINTGGTPLGFSEMTKGPRATPAVLIGDVFNGTQRYLGVTVDDGSPAVDNEISPRQQIVSTAFAFRSKYAEMLGTAAGGNSLTVGDNGNVGIGAGGFSTLPARLTLTGSSVGTGSPQLVLTDSVDTNERLQIGVDSTGNGTGFIQANKLGIGAQNLSLNANGGNVGIGTSLPRAKLEVAGAIVTLNNSTLPERGLGGREMALVGSSGSPWSGKTIFGTDGSGWRYSIASKNGSAMELDHLVVTDGGNVGIGTTSPGAKLDVAGDIKASGYTFAVPGDTDGGLFSPADGTVTLKTNAAERLRVDVSGNVGIGTITPSAKLEVAGDIKGSGKISSPQFKATEVMPHLLGLNNNNISWGNGRTADYTAGGGTWLVTINCSGFSNGDRLGLNFSYKLKTSPDYVTRNFEIWANGNIHSPMSCQAVITGLPSGVYDVKISKSNGTVDYNDFSEVTILELPY
jgi:hypothetical protein